MKVYHLLLLPPLGLLLSAVLAIPIWLLWSIGGVGAQVFPFLPPACQHPGLLDVIGLLVSLSLLRLALAPLKFSLQGQT